MSSENEIDKGIAFSDLFNYSFLLHHTAAEGNYQIRVGLFQSLDRTDIAVDTILCVFTDGTGVVKDKVCLFDIVRKAVAESRKDSLDAFSVRNIALTAVGMDKSERH